MPQNRVGCSQPPPRKDRSIRRSMRFASSGIPSAFAPFASTPPPHAAPRSEKKSNPARKNGTTSDRSRPNIAASKFAFTESAEGGATPVQMGPKHPIEFQDRRIRPLCHPSMLLLIRNLQLFVTFGFLRFRNPILFGMSQVQKISGGQHGRRVPLQERPQNLLRPR